MKPNEDAMATPTATWMGLKPNDKAVLIAIVPIRLTAAVCEANSERSSDITQNTAMKKNSDGCPPIIDFMPSPIHCDSPVENIMAPIDNPPPKSMSVPQSMPFTPSFHSRVGCLFFFFHRFRSSSIKKGSSNIQVKQKQGAEYC